jgi:SAM-dependent methyltransferase
MSENLTMKLDHVKKLYDENIKTLGAQSSAVGWSNEAGHELRLQRLSMIVQDRTEPFTLNDYGCGFASQYMHMKEQGFPPAHYYGYDISEPMLAEARKNVPENVGTFQASPEVTGEADYTVVGGTYNVRGGISEAQWLEYIQHSLLDLMAKTRKGLAFNLLTSFVDWRAEGLYYADPGYFFNWSREHLGKKVILQHDYELYEWTMLVWKK